MTSKSSAPVAAGPGTGAPEPAARLRLFVFALFFIFGVITSLNDVIIPKLKALFTLSYGEVMLVQSAFFVAYFVISAPAAGIVRRVGYMRAAVVGLLTMTLGCLLFVPASSSGQFPTFLAALFVLAAGITIVQVVANPLISLLGPPQTAPSRLTFAQAFNSLGTTIFPYVGSILILGPVARAQPAEFSGAALTAFRATETRVIVFLLLLGAAQARAPAGSVLPEPPETLFGDLFVAVQSTEVFSDGKTFVDAVPKSPPAQILASYRKAAPRSPAELRNFVEVNFALPSPPPPVVALPQDLSIAAHIDALWAHLTRTSEAAPPYSSLLPLPKPYVVPGGRFREIYYWDSYFTMLGLADSGRQDLVLDMVGDFAYLIDAYGHVPNGTRTYYLSRSQPPFFYAMTGLAAPEAPVKGFARYLRELEHEHEFWMDGAAQLRPGEVHRRALALRDGALLNRYWDDRDTPRDESYREDTELARVSGRPPGELYRDIRAAAESGWDFSTRWFADPKSRSSIITTDIVPVDLNSLLFGLEQAIAAGCRERGDSVCGRNFSAASEARRTAVTRSLWDERRGVFLDYHRSAGTRLPGLSAATLYPLFVGLATPAQAHRVAAAVRRELLRPGGLVTTPVTSGHEQWDAPNGWAPLQWIAIAGLRRYGEENLAAVIACRFMASVEGVYRSAGKLVEKYDVVNIGRVGGGGEYPLQDGFGWTNGVMRHLLTLYPKFADVKYSDCP